MSEHPQLYDDLTVKGYLAFFAGLYGVARPTERIDALLDEVGLRERGGDRAIHLSKGLQQKLGLARALLHDPPVLILDEPVSGLDPHGIREFRELVLRQRARGRAILLSSHVLSEVERTADRVGILNAGRLVALGETAGIAAALSDAVEIEIELDGRADEVVDRARAIEGVSSAEADGGRLTVRVDPTGDARRRVAREIAAAGAVVVQTRERLPTLEEAFVTLTAERMAGLAGSADAPPVEPAR